jgi:predicted MFS family arabinose efflux permease
MAVFPAIGPIIGGVITQQFSWQMIFIFLIIFSGLIFIATLKRLPETLNTDQTELPKLWDIFIKLAKDKNVIGFGLLVSICNGIVFSYFGEGAFFIIELLDVSPSIFGMTFLLMATATVIGSIVSAKMQNRIEGLKIIKYGIRLILGSNILFSIAGLAKNLLGLSNMKLFAVTVVMMMGNMMGVCIVTSNSLAMSLQKYRYAIGTASSLFGFFYYICISLWSFGMGMLHNATLLPMPLYFLGLSALMLLIFKTLNENRAS